MVLDKIGLLLLTKRRDTALSVVLDELRHGIKSTKWVCFFFLFLSCKLLNNRRISEAFLHLLIRH